MQYKNAMLKHCHTIGARDCLTDSGSKKLASNFRSKMIPNRLYYAALNDGPLYIFVVNIKISNSHYD